MSCWSFQALYKIMEPFTIYHFCNRCRWVRFTADVALLGLQCNKIMNAHALNFAVFSNLRFVCSYRSVRIISVRDAARMSAVSRTCAHLSVHRRHSPDDGRFMVLDSRRPGSQSAQHVLLAPTSERLGSAIQHRYLGLCWNFFQKKIRGIT